MARSDVLASSRRRVFAGLAGLIVVPLAIAACNGIIGLDDYQRVECTGLVCDGGARFDVMVPDGGRDSAPDAPIVTGTGAKPVSWAAWKMPNYDAGGVTENPMSYTPTADNAGLSDNVTSLVWRQPMPPQAGDQKTFEEARQLCDSIQDGPWRLPSRIELVTLLDLGQPGARIAPVFTGTSPDVYWTSSEVRPFVGPNREYWVVDFSGDGVLKKRAESVGKAYVRCVKGGPK